MSMKAIMCRFVGEVHWLSDHTTKVDIDDTDQLLKTLLCDTHFKMPYCNVGRMHCLYKRNFNGLGMVVSVSHRLKI